MDQPECYRLFTSQTSGYAATAPETRKKGDRLFINCISTRLIAQQFNATAWSPARPRLLRWWRTEKLEE
jgi:hypothetical protein